MDRFISAYTISRESSGLLLLKKKTERYTMERFDFKPRNTFINPTITILNGILIIEGDIHKYQKIGTTSWGEFEEEYWPTNILNENWKDIIVFNPKTDIAKRDIKKGWGIFKRVVATDVEHLKCGFYLSKEGIHETIKTSNFRIVDK